MWRWCSRSTTRAERGEISSTRPRENAGAAKVGRPRFKSRKDHRQSFRLTRNGFSVRDNGRLFVAKVGEVRVRWSRDLPSEPSSVTIIREPDGRFYASFVVEVPAAPLPAVQREAGVDVGITRLATIATTDGRLSDVANPKHLCRKLRKLARLEREKSRRQKGSANRDKTRRKVAVAHNEVARGAAGLSPQAGSGVGSREPSDPRRGPQHRGHGQKPSSRARHLAMRDGGSSCESSARKPTVTRGPSTRCRGGWRQARHARSVGTDSTNSHSRSAGGPARPVRWFTIATTTPPRSFSPPGGRRD